MLKCRMSLSRRLCQTCVFTLIQSSKYTGLKDRAFREGPRTFFPSHRSAKEGPSGHPPRRDAYRLWRTLGRLGEVEKRKVPPRNSVCIFGNPTRSIRNIRYIRMGAPSRWGYRMPSWAYVCGGGSAGGRAARKSSNRIVWDTWGPAVTHAYRCQDASSRRVCLL